MISEISYLGIIQVFLYLVDKQISKFICKLGKLNLNLLDYLCQNFKLKFFKKNLF